jgi:hypothetical protein
MLILNALFKVLSERAMFFLFPNRHILFIKPKKGDLPQRTQRKIKINQGNKFFFAFFSVPSLSENNSTF